MPNVALDNWGVGGAYHHSLFIFKILLIMVGLAGVGWRDGEKMQTICN